MSPKEQAKRDGWQLFMTTTNELFLPSRITYRVLNPLELVLKFQSLRSMIFEPHRNRWAWNYEFEARTLGFPDDYDRIPPERQPVVLAFCYLTAKDTLQVYVRSTLRLRKALLFFEEHVPRACAIGESFDEYNLLTAHDSRKPIPVLEDFFRDESKIAFIDIEAMTSDPAKFATESFRYAEKSLEPLERHVFEAFYEDGDRYMEMAMRMRELLALKQYGSETPIRPYDFYQEILQNAAPSAGSDASGAPIEGHAASEPNEGLDPSGALYDAGFSFLRIDRELNCATLDLSEPNGSRRLYKVQFACCPDPTCDCGVLNLILNPLRESQSTGEEIRLSLWLDEKSIERAPGVRERAEALCARFLESDWEIARQLYGELKAHTSEPTDVSRLEVPFPNAVLKDPSLTMGYQEIFPYARDIRFERKQIIWNVRELYCTNPDCSCTEVFLDFASHGDKTLPPAWNARQKDVTTIRFRYQDGTIKVSRKGPAGSPTATALMDSFKAACPEFKSRFKRRHSVLRALHNTAIAPHEPDVPPPALRSMKVGRNERCPCGSGKKYKFCCGL